MSYQAAVTQSNGKEGGDFGGLHSASVGEGAGHLELNRHNGRKHSFYAHP
jgi:hypothetical protein